MTRGSLVAALLMLAVALGFSASGVWSLAYGSGGLAWSGAVVSHVAMAGFCAEALRRRDMATEGWVLGLLLPFFAPLAAAPFVLAERTTTRRRRSPEEKRSRAARAALERRRREQTIDPELSAIADAVKDRDHDVRIAAIDALRDDLSKDAVRIYRASRDNTAYDVRMRAVEGLARISQHYSDRIGTARQQLKETPHSIALNVELAALCLSYGELELEDAVVARGLFDDAATHATHAIEIGGPDRTALILLARAFIHLREYGDAESIYRALADEDDTDADALLGISECRFHQRDFDSLPFVSRWALQQMGPGVDEQTQRALRFWVEEGV